LFHAVNRFARDTGWAHTPAKLYAKDGIAVFVVLIAAAAIVGLRRSDARALARAVWTASAALIALALNQPIANAVDRARPSTNHAHVLLLVSATLDPSFMSDHSVVAGAVAVGLLLTFRPIGIVAVVLALLMAFTRVYVGAHYPGDVLAGLVFGSLVAVAGVPLADRYLTPFTRRILDLPVSRRLAA
jgi:membrane-associated phospholipid phosphatase